jgi:hypothetical protein
MRLSRPVRDLFQLREYALVFQDKELLFCAILSDAPQLRHVASVSARPLELI